MKLINLGCGNTFHKDWINIDFFSNSNFVTRHNLLTGIPIDDNEADVVYHSHVLEHFSKNDGLSFIYDCYRVLKKEGIIRIAVPDLESIATEYLRNLHLAIEGDNEAKHNYEWIKLELFDQMVRNESGGEMKNYFYQPAIPNEEYVFSRVGMEGKLIRELFLQKQNRNQHQKLELSSDTSILTLAKNSVKSMITKIKVWQQKNKLTKQEAKAIQIGQFRLEGEIHQCMYDRYSLTELLSKIGFSDIKVCTAFESRIKDWGTFQLDVIDGVVRKPDSLFIEAKKL